MVGFCIIFDRYMHSECVCGHLWGVRIASRLDSKTRSITSFLRALCAIFLLPSILAYIGFIVGFINGKTDAFHCTDVVYTLYVSLWVVFGSSALIVICSMLCICRNFMDEFCWGL